MARNELLGEYEAVRLRQRDALLKRTQEAYALCPELKEIADLRKNALMELGNVMRAGEDPKRIHVQLSAYAAREKQLLKALGLPENHLQLQYDCPLCKDTGYVGETLREPCACLQRKKIARNAGLGNPNERFENFDESLFSDPVQLARTKKAREYLENFANGFPNTRWQNVFLTGAPGLGKTFLLNAVARRVSERGFSARTVCAYNLIRDVVAGFSAGEDRLGAYFTPALLVLDDIGTEPILRNVTVETLNALLNERLARGLHTLCATNLTFEQLKERYGERVLSRLIDTRHCCSIKLEGKNLRMV